MPKVTPVDVFNILTPAEKQQVLATLQREKQSACDKNGHKYKAISVDRYLLSFLNKTKLVCTQCGKTIRV